MDDYSFHSLLRAGHIGAGFVGLILFWCAIGTRKGSTAHVVAGKWFVIVATLIAASAGVSCVWAVCNPLGFADVQRSLTEDEQDRLSHNIRFLFVVLFTLMTWLVAGVQMGQHVIRHKSDFSQHAAVPVCCWMVSGAVSVGCGMFGVWLLIVGDVNGLLPLFLTWVGLTDSRSNIRLIQQTTTSPTAWIGKHVECMIGSGIALHTAFFVFGFKRILGIELHGVWQLVPWLIPVAIGVPAIGVLTRKHVSSLQTED